MGATFIVLAVVAVVALALALGVTPLVRAFAIRRQIGDYPSSRKIHQKFIPRLGGLGIIAAFASALLAAGVLRGSVFTGTDLQLWGISSAVLMIIALGIYDDVRGIGSLGKLIVQVVASSLVISSGLRFSHLALPFLDPVNLGIFDIPLTLLWLVGVTNAVNLIDGLDGLAVGVAAIVSGSVLVLGVWRNDPLLAVASAALLFSCAGFLRYNFHPASVFMGDTGSLFLGFVLGCFLLRVVQRGEPGLVDVSLLAAVVALAVPIVDTSVAFIRRIRRGMHPLKADKEHIHHRLMDLGLTHRQTVVSMYAMSALNGLVALLLIWLDSMYAVVLLAVATGATYFGIWRLGYVEEMRLRRGEGSPPIQPLSVARMIDKILLLLTDLAAAVAAFLVTYWVRFHSGFVAGEGFVPLDVYVTSPAMLILNIYWLVLFGLAGLYEIPWDLSRIDYVFQVVKTVALGTLILFVATLDFESLTVEGRVTTFLYGGLVALLVVTARMVVVAFERRHEILGYRRRNTVVVGTSQSAHELLEEIRRRPGLKYNVVGFIDRDPQRHEFEGLPVLGRYESIPEVVRRHNVEEIVVATPLVSREEILDIVARCTGMVPDVKIIPESIEALGGFKFEEVIGHPLIRVHPTNMRRWQWIVKRLMDTTVALVVLVPLAPVWILIAVAIRLDSRGPVFFTQERVGKKGKIFMLYKFRSMIHEAERETGPVWARPGDVRVTRLGRVLRQLRLDEVPQFINVLKGEMSLVGPRPERPFFVEQLRQEVGFYTRRLFVRPGITGWAQVRHRYDQSLDDVRAKVKYDLFYLENMSLTLDLKILLRTIFVALSGRGTH